VKHRLKWFGATANDPIYVAFSRSAKVEALKNFVVENEIGLVVIDSLSRFWRLENENDNAQVMKELSPLLDIAHETNATVLLIHHERKSGGEDGRGIRGGSALFGAVDQAILLERLVGKPSNKRILKTIGRYDSPPEIIIELRENDYETVGTPAELSEAGRLEKVKAVLTTAYETVDVIMDKAGEKRWATDRALMTLVDRGKAERKGTGKRNDPCLYRLADSFGLPKGGNPKQKKQKTPTEDHGKVSFVLDHVTRGTCKTKETNHTNGVSATDVLNIFGGKVVKS
jgi:AAA domain